MDRAKFLGHAGQLQDFILDSIEEFVTGSGMKFDRQSFLAEASSDLPTLAIEALIFGADTWPEYPEEERRVA